MVSPLNPKECFPCYHGCTRKCEQVSRAPFWSILQTIFTTLGSLEVLILSSIDKPAVCLREWENPGPSEEPLFTRPVHCSLLKPCGTWWVTDLSQASGLPLRSPSCASQISFFCSCYSASLVFLIFVFTSMFISTSAICLSFLFFFFPSLMPCCFPFWTETHQEK